jgi:very-short-patch-repair endonuclease
MDLISQVVLLGGVTDRSTLVRLRSAQEVRRAVAAGTIVRDARGRYSLARAHHARRTANAVTGVLSHRSAAAHWGWAQKHPDGKVEVTFPRTRKVPRHLREVLIPHWSNLPDVDVERGVTTVRRTLVDCLRNLPFDEALAIADSALRADDVTPDELLEIARSTRGRGRQRILCVAEAATAKAANVFESTLRSICLQIPELRVQAQYPVKVRPGLTLHPDLADAGLGLAIEAEGFEWHGESAALTRDCRRYNTLANLGWHVIRFSWYQVMFEPDDVQRVLVAAARARRARGVLPTSLGHANVA